MTRDGTETIAKALSRAARALPPDQCRQFRAFLADLPGASPKRQRKVHSWKRKKRLSVARPDRREKPSRAKPRSNARQLPLPLT